jgi:regulator of ribosome biosynthesis
MSSSIALPKAGAELSFDLALMAAFDPTALEMISFGENREEIFRKLATTTTQHLVTKIFELPTFMSDEGPVAELPERTTKLPRGKPVPQAKPMTRWEKFAKEKGIVKQKRSKMIWDEEKQKFLPRWGYKVSCIYCTALCPLTVAVT